MAAGSGASLGTATGKVNIDTQVAGRALQQLRADFKSTKADALDLSKALQALEREAAKSGRGLGTGVASGAKAATAATAQLERQQQQLVASQIRASAAAKQYDAALTRITQELAKTEPGTKRYNDLLAQQSGVVESARRAAAQLTQEQQKLERQQQQLVNAQIRAAAATKNYDEALGIVGRELAKVDPASKRYNDLLVQQARLQASARQEATRTGTSLTQLERQQQQLASAQIRAATASKNYGEALRIIDRELAKVGPETKRYNDLLTQQARVQAQVQREVEQTREALRGQLSTASGALGTLAVPLLAAGTAAGVMGSRFDTALRNINSIAKLTDAELKTLGQQFLELSTDTSKTREGATALAEGFYDIQSSGFAGADGMTVLEEATKAASAGMTETAIASKAGTAILNAYGLSAQDAGHVFDVLFKTVDRGVTTFPELAAQIGDVIGSAAAAKIPIEQVGAAIATMTKDGQSANKAITNLNSLINSVIKPTNEAADVARDYGVDLSLTALQTKGLVGFLADMNARTNGNVEAMSKMIGTQEGLKAVLSLTKGDLKAFNEDLAAMGQAAGATDAAFKEMGKSNAAQLQELRQQFERLAIVIGSQLLPRVVSAARVVNELVAAFNRLPADEQARYIDIALAVGGAVVGLFAFVKAVEGTIAVITAAKAAYGLYSAAVALAGRVSGVAAGEMLLAAGPFAVVAAAIGIALYAYKEHRDAVHENITAINEQDEALRRAIETQQRFDQSQNKGDQSNAASKELNDLLAQRAELVERLADAQVRANGTMVGGSAGQAGQRVLQAKKEVEEQTAALRQLDAQISTSTEKLQTMTAADEERARAAAIANDTTIAGLVNIEKVAKLSAEELDKLLKELESATNESAKAFGAVVEGESSFLDGLVERRAAHEDKLAALVAEKKKAQTDQQRASIDEQIAAEREGYAAQEREQAESYARQQAAQVQALGNQLIRYVQAQAMLGTIDQDRATALIETFRRTYGVMPDLVNDAFGQAKAVIDQYGQDTRISADAAGQAIQGNIDLSVELKRKYDELIGTYTAELEAKKMGLSPEDYAAELLKIPARAYTEVTSNADEAKAKIEALNPVITSIKDRFIEFKMNQAEAEGQLSSVKGAVEAIPSSKNVSITTDAGSAAARIRDVEGAVKAIPTTKHVRITADVPKMLERHSPAPIEQVLDRVDHAAKNPSRVRIEADGIESIQRVVEALGKIAQVTPTLGNVGSGSAAAGGIDSLFGQLRTVADRASVDAKAYNEKTLAALNGYLDTGSKAVDLVGKGADAFGKLVDYVGPTRESILGFSYNYRDVVADAFHRQQETNYAITKAVNEYLDTATKGVDLIGKGTDAFKKLDNYKGPLRESLLGFSFNVRDVIADAAARSRENEADIGTLTTNWLETAGQAVELLGKGAEGFAALKDFEAPQREALLAFFIATGLAVAFAGQYARDNEQALDELTTRWIETAGKVVELLGKGSENLQALEEFESPSREALTRFFIAAADAAKEAAARAEEIAPELLAAGGTFAETAGKVLAPITNGVDAFNKLAELGAIPERNLDLLIAGFVVAARKMGEAARQVDQEMLPQAVGFATSADAVVKPISSGVDAFNKLNDYKSPAAEVIQLIGNDIKRAVALMILLSSQMDKEGVEAAAVFSEALGKVFSGIKAGIDAMVALKEYEGVPQKQMDSLQSDFARALDMMQTLAAQAGTFRSYAQGWQSAISQGAASLRAGIGDLSELNGLGVSLSARIDVATTGNTGNTSSGNSSGAGSTPGGGSSFFQGNPTLQALTTPRRAESTARSTGGSSAESAGGSREPGGFHWNQIGPLIVREEADIQRIALEVVSIMQARGYTP